MYFCYSAELDLYFLSHPNALHCRNLATNPSMAMTIFSSSRFLESFHEEAVTEALNEIYAEEPAAIDPALWQMQLHVVNRQSSIVNLK